MINTAGLGDLHKIVVLNPKGGCGKTTLATNLASCYAQRGPPPSLVDCDPQGFSMRWLEQRPAQRPPVHGIEAYGDADDAAVPAAQRVAAEAGAVIFDLPAAIPHAQLHHYTYLADSLLIPVMPSAIDVHSATRLIAELLLDMQLDRHAQKVAIVANRVRRNTRSFQMLRRFLGSLKIPMIAALRDSQNFVHASEQGIGLSEMPAHKIKQDIEQINAIVRWLDKRREHMQRARAEEQRQALVAQAAYERAALRGFKGGDPVTDWLEAEREVDLGTRSRAVQEEQ